jgi:integrase
MSVHKRKRNGKTTWEYKYDAEGSTRGERRMNREYGFSTRQAAIDAENARRKTEEEKSERAAAGSPVVAALPKTLDSLLQEWFAQHVDVKLAPKTRQRYHEQAAMLDPALLKMALPDIRPMHLSREWNRLLASGGHHRKTKAPRPLSRKTVRNIAGVLSSAFKYALASDLVEKNPVLGSSPPVPRKPKGVGMTTSQVDTLIGAASGPWCMAMIMEMAVALGARRGEVLALRWSDLRNGRVTISRSLSQTKQEGLIFKAVKGHEEDEQERTVGIPEETLVKLEEHRKRQNEFRQQFIETYRTDLDLVFCDPTGAPLRPDSISATVSALFKRLKIPRPKGGALHLLRHTLASQMLDAGVPLTAVSARLGHSSIRTTSEIYAHAIHGQDDDATKKWEEYQKLARAANPPVKAVQ